MAEIKFRYFSPNEGRAVARFGTGSTIGATRGPAGYSINPDAVVPIPESEVAKYAKEYRDALRHGDLTERTEADYQAFEEARRPRPKKEEAAPAQAEDGQTIGDDEASERIAKPEDIAKIEADKAGGTET